jgi:hypothetical protein
LTAGMGSRGHSPHPAGTNPVGDVAARNSGREKRTERF